MTQEKKDTLKRYVVSSLLTFASGFIIAISSNIESITQDNIENGVLVGVLMTAIRAGIKFALEASASKLIQ